MAILAGLGRGEGAWHRWLTPDLGGWIPCPLVGTTSTVSIGPPTALNGAGEDKNGRHL